MNRIIKALIFRLRKLKYLLTKIDPISGIRISVNSSKLILGNNYANWIIPKNIIDSSSICYSVGAGEDISFDISLVKNYNSNVYIFDPTPKAIEYYNKGTSILNDGSCNFNLTKYEISKLKFFELGVWNTNGVVKFYEPMDKTHVSHSIVNLQKTESFINVEVRKIDFLMNMLHHDRIDLLKMDIEGAERFVIDTILSDKILPKILCIEFDEILNPVSESSKEEIKETILKLIKNGYELFSIDFPSNYTFVRHGE